MLTTWCLWIKIPAYLNTNCNKSMLKIPLLSLSLISLFSFLLSSFGYALENTTHEFKLENGLTVIVQEDHRTPIATTQLWYKVGASYEENGFTGISHVLEHMMFRGTSLIPGNQFSTLIALNGASQNAFTSYDYTVYFQEGDVTNLKLFLKLEADRMQNLLIKKELYEKELKVVLEERHLRVDDNPEALLRERFSTTAHIRNPYHHPVIGWKNDIENLTTEDLLRWYKTWYQPNNATLIVVGDVKPTEILTWVKEYFGHFKSTPIPSLKPRKEIKALGKQQILVKANATVPRIILGYRVPSIKTVQDKKEIYALLVLLMILDGGESTRLTKELIEKKALITELSSSYEPYMLHDTLMSFSFVPSAKTSSTSVEDTLIEEINRLKNEMVSEKELKKAKINLIAEKVFDKDSLSNQAFEIGALESIGRSWQEKELFEQNISVIQAKDIQAVARQYLTEERLTIAKLIPTTPDAPLVNSSKAIATINSSSNASATPNSTGLNSTNSNRSKKEP